jgi:hypothetical protein
MRQGEEVTVATSDRTGRSTDVAVMLRVNGSARQLQLDSRVTLLDALREHLDGAPFRLVSSGTGFVAPNWVWATPCSGSQPAPATGW